jgi:hypothetical protein
VEQIEQNAGASDCVLSPKEPKEVGAITANCAYLQPVPRVI